MKKILLHPLLKFIHRLRHFSVQTWWNVVKWVIFMLSCFYIFIFFQNGKINLSVVYQRYLTLTSPQFVILGVTLVLLVFNWGMEALKWKILLNKLQKLSFLECYKAVVAGTTVSLWIPNRVGEYLGRVLFLDQDKRIRGILSTIVGSVSQLFITIILGSIGLLFYSWDVFNHGFVRLTLLGIVALVIFLLLLFYFNIGQISNLLPASINRKKWLRKLLLVFKQYKTKDLGKVLFLSFLRYAIFSTQFYLLLKLNGFSETGFMVFMVIALMYLAQTIIPSNAFTDIGLRGISSAIFLKLVPEVSAVIAASYEIWFINLLLPALIGLPFLLFARYGKKSVA